ncbi:MAG: hypothetical protein Fur0025_41430 [Oscillatoriaceae cyanobacterium]
MNTKGYIDNRADMGRETSASNRHPELEIDFRSPHPLPEIPELHRLEAEHLAREVYVMTLLRHHDISAGRAAVLLGIDRWQLSDLMDRYGICPFAEQTVAELEREVDRLKLSLAKPK